jgi:hypothetical protein
MLLEFKSMQFKQTTLFITAVLATNLLCVPPIIAEDPNDAKIVTVAKLEKTAQHKTYVGVIPYYRVNNKTYILLGRQTKDTRKVDAGIYSDFGARVKTNDVTILQKAATVLTQDTMGELKLSEQDLKKSGKIIYKQVNPEHDVYYIFYKVSQQQFLKLKKFKVQHARLKASGIANTNLEKDQFVWFNFEDLLQHTPKEPETQKTFNVYTIDGKQMSANLRKYFIMDCLQNPELPDLIKSL